MVIIFFHKYLNRTFTLKTVNVIPSLNILSSFTTTLTSSLKMGISKFETKSENHFRI